MKIYKSIIFIALIIGLTSCNKEEEIKISHKEEITNLDNRQRTLKQTFWQPITPCEAANLTYFVNPGCEGTPYETAILEAINEYNNIVGSSINFTPASTASDATIVINCVANHPIYNSCGEGSAEFPTDINATIFNSGGSIGSKVLLAIDTDECICTVEGDCNFKGNVPPCLFKKTAMHEIGHTLGITHNDSSLGEVVNNTQGDPYIPGSVFNSGPISQENCEWCENCEFTSEDILAINSLYKSTEILGDKTICPGDLGKWCLSKGTSFDHIYWSNSQSQTSIQSTNSCVQYSFTNPGTYTIYANIYDDDCNYTVSTTITVLDNPSFYIEYNAPICLGDVVTFSIIENPLDQNLMTSWYIKYGGFNLMSPQNSYAVFEALIAGEAMVCAIAQNECGETEVCVKVNINSDPSCTGDGDKENPK